MAFPSGGVLPVFLGFRAGKLGFRGTSGKGVVAGRLSHEKRDLAGFGRHKILKSRVMALSKADAHWYIPLATP
jgi:hypothetical protein